jgi:predicted RND superfamily exporter protein
LLARLVTRSPGAVLFAAAILAGASFWASLKLEFRPSRMDMVPRDDPQLRAWQDFNEDFGGLNTILLVIEGSGEPARRFADATAAALRPLGRWIRSVTHRVDIDRLESQGPYLLEPARLEQIDKDLIDLGPLVREVRAHPTIGRLVAYIADEVGDEEAPPAELPRTLRSIEFVRNVIRALASALEQPAAGQPAGEQPEVFPSLKIQPQDGKGLRRDDAGYLASRDGRRLLVVVSPAVDLREARLTTEMMGEVRKCLDPLAARFPGVSWVATGGPIRSVEEETTVKKDMRETAIIAGIGIVVLCRVAFQGFLPAILLSLVLWTSVLYTSGLTWLLVGHINLIGAVFVPLLLGLGEDFGNYILMTYQDSTRGEGPETMEEALVVATPGVTLGALTTAAVFFSLRLHEFVAYQEMGLICGSGILMAMVCMLTLLPAAMMLRLRLLGLAPGINARSQDFGARFSLLGRIVVAASSPRKLILAAAIVMVLLTYRDGSSIDFDYNVTNLLSRSADTVKYESILMEQFGVATEFAVARCSRLDDVYRLRDTLASSPAVGVVDSLASYVPRDVESKREVVGRLAAWGRHRAAETAGAPHPADVVQPVPDQLAESLASLRNALRRPRRLANMLESRELHQALDGLEGEIDAATPSVRAAAAAQAAYANALARLSGTIAAELDRFVGFMKRAGEQAPYTLETLPPEIRHRYVSKSGQLAAYVSPAHALADESDARAFFEAMTSLEQAQAQAPASAATAGFEGTVRVAGIPLIVYRTVQMIREGFRRAAGWALATCLLMVFLDFRRVDLALLSLLPVACGVVWQTGVMKSLGLQWNPLDSIAIPILPGVGVAFGVNIIHRAIAERDLKIALASTGRAALYSAYTTIVGFGALLIAHHRGLASFGKVMVIGVMCCIVACVTVMPVLLTHLLPREAKEREPEAKGLAGDDLPSVAST